MLVSLLVATSLLLPLAPASSQESSDELRSQLGQARNRLAQLDGEASLAVEAFNEAKASLEQVEAELADSRAQGERLQGEVDRLSAVAAEVANQLFRMGPTMQIQAVMASGDPTEAGRKAATLTRITSSRMTDLEALGVRRRQLAVVRARQADQREQAAQRTEELVQRRDEVQRTLAAQRDEVSRLQAQVAEAEQREREERERREREARERRQRRAQQRQDREERERREAAAEAEAEQEAVSQPASAPATSTPEPSSPEPGVRRSAQVAVDAAVSQAGKPYQWGGSGPNSYDCSGLTSWAWNHAGVYLPHSSRMQYAATTRISRGDLQPGDLVFYGSPIHHVAMYIGGGDVVEAPYSGASVRISSSGLSRGDIAGYGRP